MDSVKGYVGKITYRNEENGYTVLTLSAGEASHCLVGTFPTVSEGEYIEAHGEFTMHPTYGPQMKVSSYEFIAPEDEVAMERYLGSGAIKGIGEKLAKRIVACFGRDTFRILEEEPERLAEVKGISERAAMQIASQVIEKREVRNAILFLQQYGFSLHMAAKIYKQYGDMLYSVVRENPYKLAEDISGIGFKSADELARKMNVAPDSDFRIRAAVVYILTEQGQNGHTYLPKDVLFARTEGLLNLILSDFDHILEDLVIDRKITLVADGTETRVYLRSYYRMELNISLRLKQLNITDPHLCDRSVLNRVEKIEKEKKVELNEDQRRAVVTAAQNGITILTGGPGTGKTTTINVLIAYFIQEGLDILLAAPTGRAAKRMTEATGYEAQTVHRLLEVSGNPEEEGSRMRFGRNENAPLEADVVIIDEVSMLDVALTDALLRAIVPGMRLVLVGDRYQLPSVGPGEVLKDMILSDCFHVVELKKIYRQTEDSDIILNAHKINAGEVFEPKPSKDFLFILRDDPAKIVGATITLLRDKLPGYVHANTRDLQVLTPMRKGILGVENLNKVLQETFNPPAENKRERDFGFALFREGDKVMQVKNDYSLEWTVNNTFPAEHGLGVFNGDVGFIQSINAFSQTLTVEFEDKKTVEYPFTLCDELELAYAVTVHKSQGSEYPAIIIPLYDVPRMLRNRNLLYTGVTRAKSCVCIVGRYPLFAEMIQHADTGRRFTGLQKMIQDAHGIL